MNIKELVDKAIALDKKINERPVELERELELTRIRLAKELKSHHVSVMCTGEVVVDYIPEGATKETIKGDYGLEFDHYKSEIDGVPIIYFSGHREVEDEDNQ